MASIVWRDLLSQSSAASLADDDLRELVVEFATGIGESIYWPGSAASQGASTASSGEMLPGGARVPGDSVGATVLFDSLDGEITATFRRGSGAATATLIHGGSTSSFAIGGGIAIEASPAPEAAAPFTSHWVADDSFATFQLTTTPADNVQESTITYGVTFNSIPTVQAAIEVGNVFGASDHLLYGVGNVGVSACSSFISFIGTPSLFGIATMNLRSEGTVAL